MEEKFILRALLDDLKLAKKTLHVASENFHWIVQRGPSELPESDGIAHIRQVSRELSAARQALMRSIDRLNDYMARRMTPQELKDSERAAQSNAGHAAQGRNGTVATSGNGNLATPGPIHGPALPPE